MLLKIENGFYLNTRHIIAVHIAKISRDESFEVKIEYMPHNREANGVYKKVFERKMEAQKFLHYLNESIH